jgi:hypothetical protein
VPYTRRSDWLLAAVGAAILAVVTYVTWLVTSHIPLHTFVGFREVMGGYWIVAFIAAGAGVAAIVWPARRARREVFRRWFEDDMAHASGVAATRPS